MDLIESRNSGLHRHPWEFARRDFIANLILDLNFSRPIEVLDVGSGDGWLASELLNVLPKGSLISCVDPHYTDEDVSVISRENINFFQALPDTKFDLILMLDVLEHIEDDLKFLKEVRTKLNPHAKLILTVPAFNSLFTTHDQILLHYRRYRLFKITSLLNEGQFVVSESGYFFLSLLPLRIIEKFLDRRSSTKAKTGISLWRRGPYLTRILHFILLADAKICRTFAKNRIRLPGLSIWMIAE